MSESDRAGGGSLLLAFLAGAAAGAVVTWLATRRETPERAADVLSGATDAAKRAARAAREAFARALEAIARGHETRSLRRPGTRGSRTPDRVRRAPR